MSVPTDISLQDSLEIQSAAFEWADSYDNKEWERLKRILGPAIRLDFRALQGDLQDNLTPDQFADVISDTKVIGDLRVQTQHFIGAGKWSSPGNGTVQVFWQLRVAHQRVDDDMKTQISFGHGHGGVQHTYKKIDGAWKIIGVAPKVIWIEGDLLRTLNPSIMDA